MEMMASTGEAAAAEAGAVAEMEMAQRLVHHQWTGVVQVPQVLHRHQSGEGRLPWTGKAATDRQAHGLRGRWVAILVLQVRKLCVHQQAHHTVAGMLQVVGSLQGSGVAPEEVQPLAVGHRVDRHRVTGEDLQLMVVHLLTGVPLRRTPHSHHLRQLHHPPTVRLPLLLSQLKLQLASRKKLSQPCQHCQHQLKGFAVYALLRLQSASRCCRNCAVWEL